MSYHSVTLKGWLAMTSSGEAPTVGGFLYVTLASVAAGLTASTVRWLALDTLHHWTGVRPPKWNFARLAPHLPAFELIVEHQYRYYQAYGNSLVALVAFYILRCDALGVGQGCFVWSDAILLVLATTLFLGSRDTLRRYYGRVDSLLQQDEEGIQSKPARRRKSVKATP